MNTHNALRLTGISKEFDGRPALNSVSFDVAWGEVHALLGENGAGKSTIMNVACGLYAPDSGNVEIDGVHVRINKPADAIVHGIGMVHQHYKLVGRFSVAENVILSCGQAMGVTSLAEAAKAISEKGRDIGLSVDPYAIVGDLSVAEQQRVEILKMLLAGARILILDEPTAVLTDVESESVLSLLQVMAKEGCAVILITHKLREVLGFSDRVTVMRSGEAVMNGEATGGLTGEVLARAMVGETDLSVPHGPRKFGRERYVVENLRALNALGGRGVDGVSFRVRAGEIYGIAGVGGNGQPELANALLGLVEPDEGKITIYDNDVTNSGVLNRRRLGLRFIPSDRFGSGLIADFQAYENLGITEVSSGHYGSWLRVDRRKMKADMSDAITSHHILGCAPTTRSRLLSGGNAQKLLLSRELDDKVGVLVAHSPTRGLDVQACNFVHQRILEAAEGGAACVLISEDLEEILSLSSTIAVMSGGRLVGELPAEEISREQIGEMMLGHV